MSEQKRLDSADTMESRSAFNRHAFGQDGLDRPELREKIEDALKEIIDVELLFSPFVEMDLELKENVCSNLRRAIAYKFLALIPDIEEAPKRQARNVDCPAHRLIGNAHYCGIGAEGDLLCWEAYYHKCNWYRNDIEETKKQERERIISWLRDLGADEHLLGKLNNNMIIKAIQAGEQALGEK